MARKNQLEPHLPVELFGETEKQLRGSNSFQTAENEPLICHVSPREYRAIEICERLAEQGNGQGGLHAHEIAEERLRLAARKNCSETILSFWGNIAYALHCVRFLGPRSSKIVVSPDAKTIRAETKRSLDSDPLELAFGLDDLLESAKLNIRSWARLVEFSEDLSDRRLPRALGYVDQSEKLISEEEKKLYGNLQRHHLLHRYLFERVAKPLEISPLTKVEGNARAYTAGILNKNSIDHSIISITSRLVNSITSNKEFLHIENYLNFRTSFESMANIIDLDKNSETVYSIKKEKDRTKEHTLPPNKEKINQDIEIIANKHGLTADEFLKVAKGDDSRRKFVLEEIPLETKAVSLTWPSNFYRLVEEHVDQRKSESGEEELTVTGFISSVLKNIPPEDELMALPLGEIIKPGPQPAAIRESGKPRHLSPKVPVDVIEALDRVAGRRGNRLKRTNIIKSLVEREMFGKSLAPTGTDPKP